MAARRLFAGLVAFKCALMPLGLAADGALMPQEPPARYAGEYSGDLEIRHVNPDEMAWRCKTDKAAGCAFVWPGRCRLYMPRKDSVIPFRGHNVTVTEEFYDALLHHELAHCNGWPITHDP